jgi:hypothetical protein
MAPSVLALLMLLSCASSFASLRRKDVNLLSVSPNANREHPLALNQGCLLRRTALARITDRRVAIFV